MESSWSGPQAYAQRGPDAPPLTQVNGWMQKDVAEAIMQAAGRDLSQLSAAAKQRGFKAVPLGLAASTSFENDIRKFQSRNVIAMLPGHHPAGRVCHAHGALGSPGHLHAGRDGR